jgi:serine/threonine-protein kinase
MSFERRKGLSGTETGLDRKNARRGLISLAAGIGALAAGYLIAATVVFSSPDRTPEALVAVPDLIGESAERAREGTEAAGLSFLVTGEIHHPDEPVGNVIAQLPLPGQFVIPETEVQGTLSLGPAKAAVPDVVGLSESQASLVLSRLGLSTTTTTTASQHRKGQVIRIEPEAGEILPVPSEVNLIVSEGREVVAVPDLEGRHLDDVEVLLARLGLLIGTVTFEPGALGAPGRVIGQSPPPGFGLREGGEVSVRVAGSPSDVIRMIQGRQEN